MAGKGSEGSRGITCCLGARHVKCGAGKSYGGEGMERNVRHRFSGMGREDIHARKEKAVSAWAWQCYCSCCMAKGMVCKAA